MTQGFDKRPLSDQGRAMIKFLPLLLPIAYGIAAYLFSAYRTRRMLDANSSRLNDPQLEPIMKRFAEALDLEKIEVHIFEIEPVNGLAAPDGRIFLTRGFYQAFRRGEVSAEEMASVIAHELGHVALGHTRRRMIDFSGQNAVFASLVALLLRAIPVIGPLIAMWMAGAVTRLLAAHLSRGDEFEADAWASALLIKSGIGTGPQISLFQKLDALVGRGADAAPAWLLSHPKTAERIKAISENAARWDQPKRL